MSAEQTTPALLGVTPGWAQSGLDEVPAATIVAEGTLAPGFDRAAGACRAPPGMV